MPLVISLIDLFKECIYFIIHSTLALSLILLFVSIVIALIVTPVVIFLIFTRKIAFIISWDKFWDSVVPIAEKGLIVAAFIFLFTTAGSYLDLKIGTTVEFSSLSGIVGAIVGIRFLFIM